MLRIPAATPAVVTSSACSTRASGWLLLTRTVAAVRPTRRSSGSSINVAQRDGFGNPRVFHQVRIVGDSQHHLDVAFQLIAQLLAPTDTAIYPPGADRSIPPAKGRPWRTPFPAWRDAGGEERPVATHRLQFRFRFAGFHRSATGAGADQAGSIRRFCVRSEDPRNGASSSTPPFGLRLAGREPSGSLPSSSLRRGCAEVRHEVRVFTHRSRDTSAGGV